MRIIYRANSVIIITILIAASNVVLTYYILMKYFNSKVQKKCIKFECYKADN